MPWVCDHCGWEGGDEFPHPRGEEVVLCPGCWADGYEAPAREKLGPLMEAVLDHAPGPRSPKAMIDWTDEEWEVAARVARFKAAHEAAPVYLETTVEDAHQGGFDFMRSEFKVQPKRRDGR